MPACPQITNTSTVLWIKPFVSGNAVGATANVTALAYHSNGFLSVAGSISVNVLFQDSGGVRIPARTDSFIWRMPAGQNTVPTFFTTMTMFTGPADEQCVGTVTHRNIARLDRPANLRSVLAAERWLAVALCSDGLGSRFQPSCASFSCAAAVGLIANSLNAIIPRLRILDLTVMPDNTLIAGGYSTSSSATLVRPFCVSAPGLLFSGPSLQVAGGGYPRWGSGHPFSF